MPDVSFHQSMMGHVVQEVLSWLHSIENQHVVVCMDRLTVLIYLLAVQRVCVTQLPLINHRSSTVCVISRPSVEAEPQQARPLLTIFIQHQFESGRCRPGCQVAGSRSRCNYISHDSFQHKAIGVCVCKGQSTLMCSLM